MKAACRGGCECSDNNKKALLWITMTIIDFIRSLRSSASERLSSPLAGSIIFAWLGINWQFVLYMLLSDQKITEKLKYTNENLYSTYSFMTLPLLIGIGIAIAFPVLSAGIFWIKEKLNQLKHNAKLTLRNEMLTSKERASQLQKDLNEYKLKLKTLHIDQDDEIQEISTSHDKAIKQITERHKAELQTTNDQANLQISQIEAKNQNSLSSATNTINELKTSIEEYKQLNKEKLEGAIKRETQLLRKEFELMQKDEINLLEKTEFINKYITHTKSIHTIRSTLNKLLDDNLKYLSINSHLSSADVELLIEQGVAYLQSRYALQKHWVIPHHPEHLIHDNEIAIELLIESGLVPNQDQTNKSILTSLGTYFCDLYMPKEYKQ
jgi:hypothetical protein